MWLLNCSRGSQIAFSTIFFRRCVSLFSSEYTVGARETCRLQVGIQGNVIAYCLLAIACVIHFAPITTLDPVLACHSNVMALANMSEDVAIACSA